MFYFTSQIFHHNTITVDKAEDILHFRPVPAVYPPKKFGVVFAYFIFRNNKITIRNQKLNNEGIQDTSPEYSGSTYGDTCVDGFKNPTYVRLMLEGQSHNQKSVANILEATDKLHKH